MSDGRKLFGTLAIAIVLMFLLIGKCEHDRQERWAKFLQDNECRLVREVSSSNSPGFGVSSSGSVVVGVVQNKAQKCWVSNDGVEHCK